MAKQPEPKSPTSVVSETTSWHTEDGSPTDDSDKAVSAEVTTTYADGRVQHRLLRKVN